MKESVKLILNNGHLTEEERGQLLIRSLSQTIECLVNYNYAITHYKGGDNSTVLEDKLSSVANRLALLTSDLELYEEHFGIKDFVDARAERRINRLAGRILAREEERLGNENISN